MGFEPTMPITKERALSPLFVKNAPVGFHCDGGGLYLSVRPLKAGDGVARSWIFRYRRQGRLRDLGIGPLSTVTLAAARERARQARQKLLDGVDPIDRVYVDKELAREGFTYVLKSGKSGAVHIEQVLEYRQDPAYLRDVTLYKLAVEAQKQLQSKPNAH